MVIETLRSHWITCQRLRHGTDAEKRMAKAIFQTSRFLFSNKVVTKALRHVDIQPKKTA